MALFGPPHTNGYMPNPVVVGMATRQLYSIELSGIGGEATGPRTSAHIDEHVVVGSQPAGANANVLSVFCKAGFTSQSGRLTPPTSIEANGTSALTPRQVRTLPIDRSLSE